MKTVIGIWCRRGKALLERVHDVPLLRLTIKRVGPCYALIPWSPDLDWLDGEVRSWKACQVRRTHPDKLVAMRDLVVELGADVGTLIPGDCAAIDRAEIKLVETGIGHPENKTGRYANDRLICRNQAQWLEVTAPDEWGPYPASVKDLQTYLRPGDLEERWLKAIERKKA